MSISSLDLRPRSRLQKDRLTQWLPHVIACGVGFVLGGILLEFGAVWSLIALATVVLAFAVLNRPEIGLLGILVATSTIVPESELPLLRLGGIGSLHIPDVVLLSLLMLILVRSLVEPGFKIVHTPLDLPMLSFYAVAIIFTLHAVSQGSIGIEDARRAIRTITYFLTFFVVTNLVRNIDQLRLLLRGISFLAIIVALAMVTQFLFGHSMSFLPGRVEILNTAGTNYSDVTRVLPPGESLVIFWFLITTVMLVLEKCGLGDLQRLIRWLLLGLAVVLTYNRSYWAISGLILVLLFWLISKQDKQRMIALSLVVMLLLAVILGSASVVSESRTKSFLEASLSRLATLVNPETTNESSLQWRYIEMDYALQQIVSHPLSGLGLGAQYRPFDSRIDYVGQKWDARGYMHNAHLWIMVDIGLLGYACLVWLSFVFLIRGFRHWREIKDPQMQSIVLGTTLAYLGLQFTALVDPIFMQWFWVPVLGIMLSVNEVILRIDSQKPVDSPTEQST